MGHIICHGESIRDALQTDDYEQYYLGRKRSAVITAQWAQRRNIGHIVLKENIRKSQRIESFTIEARTDGGFVEVFSGTIVGYKRIVPLDIETDCIRIYITDSRIAPTLSFVGIYENQR